MGKNNVIRCLSGNSIIHTREALEKILVLINTGEDAKLVLGDETFVLNYDDKEVIVNHFENSLRKECNIISELEEAFGQQFEEALKEQNKSIVDNAKIRAAKSPMSLEAAMIEAAKISSEELEFLESVGYW